MIDIKLTNICWALPIIHDSKNVFFCKIFWIWLFSFPHHFWASAFKIYLWFYLKMCNGIVFFIYSWSWWYDLIWMTFLWKLADWITGDIAKHRRVSSTYYLSILKLNIYIYFWICTFHFGCKKNINKSSRSIKDGDFQDPCSFKEWFSKKLAFRKIHINKFIRF